MISLSPPTICNSAGTRDAYLAIRSDDQLENRFEPLMLPVWEANDDCCSLLASFAASPRCGGLRQLLRRTWPATC
jgi:hypothetical protein